MGCLNSTLLAVEIPNYFVNGQVADANQVNQNFSVLANAINGANVMQNLTVNGSANLSGMVYPTVMGQPDDILTMGINGQLGWSSLPPSLVPSSASVGDLLRWDGQSWVGAQPSSAPANDSVTTAKIADGTIATADLADSSITTAKIADGTVADSDLAGSISASKITNTAATLSDTQTLTNKTLTSPIINDGAMTGSNINNTPIGNTTPSTGKFTGLYVGGSNPATSAVVEFSSSTKGFLPPRMTFAQRNAIVSPAEGLMIYCTDCGGSGEPQFFDGGRWKKLSGGPASQPVAESLAISSQYTTTNATGGTQQGQSFTLGANSGYLTKILTNAIGGSSGTQLTNGIAASTVRIRAFVNNNETGTGHALSGNILATFTGTPTILNDIYGVYYPTVEFAFDGNLYLEANTPYILEIIQGSGVSVYVQITGSYTNGQAYDIDGINHGIDRDIPFSLYMKPD